MSIGKNIKKLREMHNLSQKELAEIIGVTDKAVSTWENEIKEPRMGAIQKIADHFGLLKSNIIEEDGINNIFLYNEHENSSQSTLDKMKQKTIVYGKICAGNGILAYEDIIDEIICPYERAKGEIIALQVSGESMNKTIPNGDYALIKLQPTVESGQIAAIIIDGENAMLKRFYKIDEGTILLKPESYLNDFSSKIFEGEEINNLKIIGKYIGRVSPYLD